MLKLAMMVKAISHKPINLVLFTWKWLKNLDELLKLRCFLFKSVNDGGKLGEGSPNPGLPCEAYIAVCTILYLTALTIQSIVKCYYKILSATNHLSTEIIFKQLGSNFITS